MVKASESTTKFGYNAGLGISFELSGGGPDATEDPDAAETDDAQANAG